VESKEIDFGYIFGISFDSKDEYCLLSGKNLKVGLLDVNSK